jgi:ArsR family transcriptional regulator, arsenate/arsenite/antimonite-responsive transcriptional repressor
MRANSFTPELWGKCICDATRARIALLVMHEEELCVCELSAALDESQPKISRHLALLREMGLLQDRRQGQWIYYRLHPLLPAWVNASLHILLAANTQWLAAELLRLSEMQDRPQRCC